jgi:hypothetical protein
MLERDYDLFAQMLDDVAELRQLQPLSANAKALFFRAVARFPIEQVEGAIQAHLIDPEAGKFKAHIQPAHIIAQIEAAVADDGRPGADEAWAIALLARDEAATVVWTEETAQAFAACKPVLDLGDEVGARMAFRQTYDRLVNGARKQGQPNRWQASLGFDMALREQALHRAATAGLLPAPHAAALLPPPLTGEDIVPDSEARAAIARIQAMLASAMSPAEKLRRGAEAASQAERDRVAELKRETDEKVRRYLGEQA